MWVIVNYVFKSRKEKVKILFFIALLIFNIDFYMYVLI